MKMRGKMIDGSPVTFESIDLGAAVDCYITDFVGEGFYVRSAWNGMAFPLKGLDGNAYRLAHDRAMLKRAGVDLATVERLHCWDGHGGETWEVGWPGKRDTSYLEALSEPLKDEPAAFMGERVIHRGFGPFEVNGPMPDVAAGCAVLHDVVSRMLVVENGKVHVMNPQRAVTRIWRAMMLLKP